MMATRTMMKRVALQLVSNKNGGITARSFHSSSVALLATNKKKSTKSRDFRLAGRLRFYKQVGVVEVAPPWEDSSDKDADDSIESPISAGVDGSASASGVQHLSSKHVASTTKEDLQWMLSPRSPGSMDVKDNTQWFGIALDGRTVQTPMGQKLAVPSQSLAFAIAAEWDAQVKHLQPADMPIMTLACTALDQAAYHPQVYRDQAMNFLPTDTVSSLYVS
jgi:ATP synthase F1 complex assembly factor 2